MPNNARKWLQYALVLPLLMSLLALSPLFTLHATGAGNPDVRFKITHASTLSLADGRTMRPEMPGPNK